MNKDNVVTVVNKDELVFKVSPVQLVSRVKSAMQVVSAFLDQKVIMDNLDHKVQKVLLVYRVQVDNMEKLDLKVNPAKLDNLANLEALVLEVPKVTLVLAVKTVQSDHKVRLDQWDLLVKTVPRDMKDHRVCPEILVHLDHLASLVKMVPRENLEMMDVPENLVCLALKVMLVLWDLKVDVDPPVLLAQWAKKAKRELKVILATLVHLVYPDNLDLKVPLVNPVSMVSEVFLAPLVNQVYLVNLETWVNLVQSVQLA